MRPAALALLAPLLLFVTVPAHAQDDEPPPLGVSTGGTTSADAPTPPTEAPPETAPTEESGTASSEEPAAEPTAGRRNAARDANALDEDPADEDPLDEDPLDDAEDEDEDEDDEERAPPGWNDGRVAAWATLGTSFGVAILGGVLMAAGLDAVTTVENAPDGTRWEDVAGARERGPILTGAGAAVLGLGALGTAVGAALLAHFGEGGTWLAVSALPGGVVVRGAF